MLINHTNGQLLYFEAEDKHKIHGYTAPQHQVDAAIQKYKTIFDILTDWEPFPPNTQLPLLAECATCGGGGLAHYDLHDCDVCGGKGWLWSKIQDRSHACPACVLDDYAEFGADGKIAIPNAGGNQPCPDCDGWGVLRGNDKYALCGLVVNPIYAIRVIEPGAMFSQIWMALDSGKRTMAVAFRSPTATGFIIGICHPRNDSFDAAIRFGCLTDKVFMDERDTP